MTIEVRDWRRSRDSWIRLLEARTGAGLAAWNRRIRRARFDDERQLRAWLSRHHVTGYARQLLIMEHFGYPDFITATASELIDGQYAHHPDLRAILDAIVKAASTCGRVVVQARKTYVSLVARRTFGRVWRANGTTVALGLRLHGEHPSGRLRPSRIHETMRYQIDLTAPEQVDSEVRGWLQRAYRQNA